MVNRRICLQRIGEGVGMISNLERLLDERHTKCLWFCDLDDVGYETSRADIETKTVLPAEGQALKQGQTWFQVPRANSEIALLAER